MNSNYDIFCKNYENFFLELSTKNYEDIASKSGANSLEDNMLLLSFFNQYLLVNTNKQVIFILPSSYVERKSGQSCIIKKEDLKTITKFPEMKDKFTASIVLHYLLTADGTQLSCNWTSYRELPGGMFYADTIPGVLSPLKQKYQTSGNSFINKIIEMGGKKSDISKFACIVSPFGRFPILFILEEKDEEFDADIRALFDKSATHYLKPDIIKTLLVYIVKNLADL